MVYCDADAPSNAHVAWCVAVQVHLVRYGETGEKLAVKVQLTAQWRRAMVELKVMLIANGNSPFLVNLHSHFRTSVGHTLTQNYHISGHFSSALSHRQG